MSTEPPRQAGPDVFRLRRARGFSLIELLVVITLLVLLIALLMPVLALGRVTSQANSSLVNCRQIAQLLHSYAYDNNSSMPYVRFWLPSQSNPPYSWPIGMGWAAKLYTTGYVDDVRIFWSPARELGWLDFDALLADPNSSRWLYVGYGTNGLTEEYKDVYPTLRLDNPSNPPASDHLLLVEFFDPDKYFNQGIDGFHGAAYWFRPFDYNGRIVRAYVDGHAAWRDGLDIDWVHTAHRQGYWTSFLHSRPWYAWAYRSEW